MNHHLPLQLSSFSNINEPTSMYLEQHQLEPSVPSHAVATLRLAPQRSSSTSSCCLAELLLKFFRSSSRKACGSHGGPGPTAGGDRWPVDGEGIIYGRWMVDNP